MCTKYIHVHVHTGGAEAKVVALSPTTTPSAVPWPKLRPAISKVKAGEMKTDEPAPPELV